MRTLIFQASIILIFFFGYTSCNTTGELPLEGGKLEGTTWKLISMPGDLPSDVQITLSFEADKLNGKGVCNQYFSGYSTAGENIEINAIGATKMFCQQHSNIEAQYFSLLSKAEKYGISGQKLIIETTEGKLEYENG